MERLGELLRKAREAQGLSIEDIYRITRVNMPMLRALEGNHLEKLPVPVIARGFIKSYCKAVGINEAKALDIYDQELGPREPELVDRLHIGNSDRSMKWIFILAIIVVVILGIMLFIYSSWKQDGIRKWRSSGSGVKKNALPAGHMKKSTMVRRKIFPESPLSAQAQTPMNSQRKLPDTQKIQSIP